MNVLGLVKDDIALANGFIQIEKFLSSLTVLLILEINLRIKVRLFHNLTSGHIRKVYLCRSFSVSWPLGDLNVLDGELDHLLVAAVGQFPRHQLHNVARGGAHLEVHQTTLKADNAKINKGP